MKKIAVLFFILTSLLFSQGYSSEDEMDKQSFVLFAGNSNPDLASEVANILGVDINEAEVTKFNDGEISININDTVKGKDVYILQSICSTKKASVNDNLMELYLLIRACKRSSANRIIAVIPYFGYARQDRKHSDICPISASDIAMLLENAGVDHIISLDLHCAQIQGFFHNIPVDNLMTNVLFIPFFERKNVDNLVVVATHAKAVSRCRKCIEGLSRYNINSKLAVFARLKQQPNSSEELFLVGDVKNLDVLLVDDMCDTGNSMVKAAAELKKKGAKKIYAYVTHPVFSDDTMNKIKNSYIDEMIVTDTIPLRHQAPNNITQISTAPLIAAAIKRTQRGESLSNLFKY